MVAKEKKNHINDELDSFFKKCYEEDIDELDAFLELGEKGFTLKDFEGTEYFDYAKEFSKTHSWERNNCNNLRTDVE